MKITELKFNNFYHRKSWGNPDYHIEINAAGEILGAINVEDIFAEDWEVWIMNCVIRKIRERCECYLTNQDGVYNFSLNTTGRVTREDALVVQDIMSIIDKDN